MPIQLYGQFLERLLYAGVILTVVAAMLVWLFNRRRPGS
jgi:hypothetical protein